MILKTDKTTLVICDECGQMFETDGRQEDRARWRAEGWLGISRKHYCGDCGVDELPLKNVQEELRNPRKLVTPSSWMRRQALWKRLDQLITR
jgi:hypothetical protein